jgi:hypothetical protein
MSESSKSKSNEYDPITYHHWQEFEIRRLKGSGDYFQQLFEEIMVRHRPGFTRVRPYGNIGDRKCDGLFQDDAIFFQVYSPDELTQAKVQKKIDEDLDGAIAHWGDALKEWFFVYNVKSGVAPDIIKTLDKKRKQYPDIKIEELSNDALWEMARRLSLQQRSEILGVPPQNTAPSIPAQDPAVIAEIYRNWLQENTAYLIVPGISQNLSMADDWLPLRSKWYGGQVPFKAEVIPDVYRLSVVAGEPGSGKSTLTKYLAHYLSGWGKIVLRVRLTSICKLLSNGESFGDAILKDATSDSSLNIGQSRLALSNPNCLFADGSERANVAAQLISWANGHPATKVIVTTRISYEPELFPGWKSLELLPLESSDIFNFARRLLGDSFDRTRFQTWLEGSGTVSLAVKNPLLLGFLLQIFQQESEPIQNRAKLYEKLINLAYKRPLQDRESDTFSESIANRVLEIAGWKLLNSPACSKSELRKYIGRRLAHELEITQLKAENQAEEGLTFWEQRRIFERIKSGYDEAIVFIHPTIGEYAAAGYACGESEEEFRQWLTAICKKIAWEGSISLANDLGKSEAIAIFLLYLERQGMNQSEEILLNITQEPNNLSPETEIRVINRFQAYLESSTRSIVFEVAERLVDLAPNSSSLVLSIARPYLEHSQSWTRLAAITLSLASGNEDVDIHELGEQIDQIISKAEQDKENAILRSERESKQDTAKSATSIKISKIFGKRPRPIWIELASFHQQVITQGLKFLLKKKLTVETAHRMRVLFAEDLLNPNSKEELISLMLKNLKRIEEPGNTDDQTIETKRILGDLISKAFRSSLPRVSSLDTLFLQQRKLIVARRRTNRGNQIFLEAILRVTEQASRSPSLKQAQDFPLLGILIQGMSFWESSIHDWEMLGECQDLEVVDTVINGAIAAMNLDSQRLRFEAQQLLSEQIRQDRHLEEIEAELNVDGLNTQVVERLLEVEHNIFFKRIPKVPAIPQWERVKGVDISMQALKNALDHPSAIIHCHAVLILERKIGRVQTAEIMKSKGWDRESIDLFLAEEGIAEQ